MKENKCMMEKVQAIERHKIKAEIEDSCHFLNIYTVSTLKNPSDVLVGTTI